jgi:hypothetical protein
MTTVETEILSSTSEDVCELWDGEHIFRTPGDSKTIEIIYTRRDPQRSNYQTWSLAEAVLKGRYAPKFFLEERNASIQSWYGMESFSEEKKVIAERLSQEAPNLTLNIRHARAKKFEARLFAIFGILLQALVLAVTGLGAYYWEWQNRGRVPARYGFPCFAVGTAGVILGIFICSYVVDAATVEEEFCPVPASGFLDSDYRVIRLQIHSKVGQQDFPAYAIVCDENDPLIRTSRRTTSGARKRRVLTMVGSLLTIAGYICQFVGFRVLNPIAVVIQLGTTLLMTAIRALECRGLAISPTSSTRIPGNYELPGTACLIRGCTRWQFPTGAFATSNHRDASETDPQGGEPSEFVTGPPDPGYYSLGSLVLNTHTQLEGTIASIQEVAHAASQLATAFERILNFLVHSPNIQLDIDSLLPVTGLSGRRSRFQWSPTILCKEENEDTYETAIYMSVDYNQTRKDFNFKEDMRQRLHAILSLWIFTLVKQNITPATLHRQNAEEKLFLHIVGHFPPEQKCFAKDLTDDSSSVETIAPGYSVVHRWLGEIETVPFPGGTVKVVDCMSLDYGVHPHPVFGLRYSTRYCRSVMNCL